MGHPMLNWNEVPLAYECDTLSLPIDGTLPLREWETRIAFFVDDAEQVNLKVVVQKLNITHYFQSVQIFNSHL